MSVPTPSRPYYSTPFNKKKLLFISDAECREICEAYGTPLILYSEAGLQEKAEEIRQLPEAYGLTVRYAVKANSHCTLVTFFDQKGIHFDASSHWEVLRLLHYGVAGHKIRLTAQAQAPQPEKLLQQGVKLNATSLHQLDRYAIALQKINRRKEKHHKPGLALRINSGTSSSAQYKINVAGMDSSFGIWHEDLPKAHALAEKHGIEITCLHVHLSSNHGPEEWIELIAKTLSQLLPQMPSVHTFNLGGGFSVARAEGETTTRLPALLRRVKTLMTDFAKQTGRRIHVEIEPGAYLTAENGMLIAAVEDIVRTQDSGKEHFFVKLNTGMNHLLRPALYGAQHYIKSVRAHHGTKTPSPKPPSWQLQTTAKTPIIIVGHCCEKGDLFTPADGNPNDALPRTLGPLTIGAYLIITGVGAYGTALANNYNSFPMLTECWYTKDRKIKVIRHKQTLQDMIRNEINIFK